MRKLFLLVFLLFIPTVAHAAVSTKAGTITIGTGTGSQAFTGIGFTPKALILFSTGATATGDVAPAAASGAYNIGFATDTTHRAALSLFDTGYGQHGAAIQYIADQGTPGVCDLTSFDADGFHLTCNPAVTTTRIFGYYALGGSDITNATVQQIQAPASTGNQSYTGFGFQPDICMFISAGSATAPPAHASNVDSAQSVGLAMSSTNRWEHHMVGNSATPGSRTRLTNDRVVGITDSGNTTNILKVDVVTYDADGVTLFYGNTTLNVYIWLMCLKGGNHAIGTFSQPTSAGTQATVTSPGFQPTGMFVDSAELTPIGTDSQPMTVTRGAASSSSSRWSIGKFNDNSQSANFDASSVRTDRIYEAFTATSPSTVNVQSVADFVSFDQTGFTWNFSTVDATARIIGFWTIGSTSSLFDTLSWQENDPNAAQFNIFRGIGGAAQTFLNSIPGGSGTFGTTENYLAGQTNR